MIPIDLIQKTAETLMDKAAIEIPDDYLEGLKAAASVEDGDLSSFVLQAMLENYKAAKEDRRAMCGDTGTPRWYVKMGNETQVEGGPIALEAALRRATANATNGVPLRPNRVHPLWRTDHDNNVGIGAPEIEYGYEPGGEWIDLITVHKGGLFGTDYRMLFPSDGVQGIKRFFLDSLVAFGKRGLACQPAIIGIGLGGWAVLKFGVARCVVTATILIASTNLFFAAMVITGPKLWMLAVTISADNIAQGFGGTVLIAYLSSLVNVSYTATQYALLSSIMSLLPKFVAGYSGEMQEWLGWLGFFLYAAALGVPAIILAIYISRRHDKLIGEGPVH